MRRLSIGAVVAAIMAIALAAPASAITGNFRPDSEHEFVGLIAFYDADGVFLHRCTGELLSPSVVLTAGHCTDDGTGDAVSASARIWVLEDVGSHYDPATQHDDVTGYPDSCTGTLGNGLGVWCAESTEMYNYGFDNFAGAPDIHDLGIVILTQPLNLPEYASLASAGTVEALIKARGTQDTTMRVSGYGLSYRLITPPKNKQGQANNLTVSFRVRLQADETWSGMNGANDDGFSFSAQGNGNDRGGTCNGDSGGPVLYPADSNRVVAVSSWGILNAGCRGLGHYYRTDRGETLTWIQSVVGPARWAQIVVN